MTSSGQCSVHKGKEGYVYTTAQEIGTLGDKESGAQGRDLCDQGGFEEWGRRLQMEETAGPRQTKRKFMDVRSHGASGLAVQGLRQGPCGSDHYPGLGAQGEKSELFD